jgi:DNA modification methylase
MKIICKNIFDAIDDIKDNSVRCIITSPPYYNVRDYGDDEQIGLEKTPKEYIDKLIGVFEGLRYKVTDDGNLFINLGDKYNKDKSLMLIPNQFALRMINNGWILRNKIIWYKPNHQPSPVKDRLTNTYEEIFHFVKQKDYYYDLDSIRIPVKQDIAHSQKVYRRFKDKINQSDLSDEQKQLALQELNKLYKENKINKDARLKLKGQHKTLYGGNSNLSGRAKELETKGYYFHCNNPKGKNMGDLLSINIKSHKGIHEAVFPDDLVKPLIKVGSAKGDIVLDPFAGTGTTCKVADELERNGLGVELNRRYIKG